MDKVLWGTEIYTGVYFDNIIIHSQTWKEHSDHVSQVLNRLDKAGLTLKLTKCKFAPLKNKVIAVKEIPKPQTKKKEIRTFLGLTGYYRRYIRDYAAIAVPLIEMTKKRMPNNIIWTQLRRLFLPFYTQKFSYIIHCHEESRL